MWSTGHAVIERGHGRAVGLSCGKTSLAALVLLVAWGTLPVLEAQVTRGPARVAAKSAKAKQKQPPAPVQAEIPPAPLLPYQLPAQAPTVSFRNGQLGIVAENSTLAGVLEQVRVATGAAVEASPSVGQERVSVRLGPGAPRDVMADLLNGSNYNYVLLGSLRDPRGLERIIVSPRGAAVASSASPPSPIFPVRVQRPPQPEEEPEIVPESEEVPEEPQPVPGENQPGAPQAAPQPGALPGPVTPAPGQPPQVKTPQELLQELQERMRRHQEEQEQQRQQPEEEEPK